MRCKACDAEMILIKVAKIDPTGLLGFERHNFTCSACRNVKWDLVFIRDGRETDLEPLPEHRAPPIVPSLVGQDERIAAARLSSRAILDKPRPHRRRLEGAGYTLGALIVLVLLLVAS